MWVGRGGVEVGGKGWNRCVGWNRRVGRKGWSRYGWERGGVDVGREIGME